MTDINMFAYKLYHSWYNLRLLSSCNESWLMVYFTMITCIEAYFAQALHLQHFYHPFIVLVLTNTLEVHKHIIFCVCARPFNSIHIFKSNLILLIIWTNWVSVTNVVLHCWNTIVMQNIQFLKNKAYALLYCYSRFIK